MRRRSRLTHLHRRVSADKARARTRSAWVAHEAASLGDHVHVQTTTSRRKAYVAAHKPGWVLLVWSE